MDLGNRSLSKLTLSSLIIHTYKLKNLERNQYLAHPLLPEEEQMLRKTTHSLSVMTASIWPQASRAPSFRPRPVQPHPTCSLVRFPLCHPSDTTPLISGLPRYEFPFDHPLDPAQNPSLPLSAPHLPLFCKLSNNLTFQKPQTAPRFTLS